MELESITIAFSGKCPFTSFTGVNVESMLKSRHCNVGLTHWGRDNMVVFFNTTFSNAFSWNKKYWILNTIGQKLFPMVQLTIIQHWFRQWLGANKATSNYLNQLWLRLLTDKCISPSRNELNSKLLHRLKCDLVFNQNRQGKALSI